MKKTGLITVLIVATLFSACSGSKKYFKAAEKLELQGLVNEAAEYYLQALQRKSTNVDARIKLKEVGQKYVSSLSSEFFRYYNTQQFEPSLQTFEKLKEFTNRTSALNVQLDYPRNYEDDYQKAVDQYCSKNYSQAHQLVNQKKYLEALPYINKVEKYKPSYRNLRQLEIIATCEPLYQSAISSLETKNYAAAQRLLADIKVKTDNYKDSKDLLELASAQQNKTFILFSPKPAANSADRALQEYLYEQFSQSAERGRGNVQILNNTPFNHAPASTDLNNSTNVDLIQAIRKASGADFFYVFDVSNSRETSSGITRTPSRGYEEIVTRVNDTTTRTEYRVFNYNVVKTSRSYSIDFKYKIIDAYSNQVISSNSQQVKATDAVEYQEFAKKFEGNINSLFPYNPAQTPPMGRYNPKAWRSSFSARSQLRSFEELKAEALQQTVKIFSNSSSRMLQ